MTFLLNSTQKNYTTNDKDYYKLKNSLKDGQELKVKSYVLAVDIPNINEYNKDVIVDDGSVSYPVVLTEGLYNHLDLRTEVENALNATGSAIYTVVFSNGKYTINSNVPITYKKLTENKSIWEMINIKQNTPVTVNAGGPPNINPTNYINIGSFELTRFKRINDTGSSNNGSLLCSIRAFNSDELFNAQNLNGPDTVNSRLLSDEFYNYKSIIINPRQTITQVDIMITDDDGNSILKYVTYSLEMLIE